MKWMPPCALLFLALTSSLAACKGAMTDPGPGKRVELEITRSDYRSGDSVSIDVMNLSDIDLTYPGSFCPKTLQRLEAGGWAPVPAPDHGQGCPMSIGVLGARARQPTVFPLPIDLADGVYRILLPAPTADIRNPNLAEPPLATREFTVNSHAF